jgi:osmotically-inducible protein OsmY
MDVRVESGEVTLEGTVDDRWEKRLAEDVAEAVPGVRDVHNRLRTSASTEGAAATVPGPMPG